MTLIGVAVKRCGKCRQELPLTAFALDRTRHDGYKWRCRACARAARQQAQAGKPRRRQPTSGPCRNCRAGKHGRWCCAALFGPACPCRCRAVLGLDGPFEFADPTAPSAGDRMEVA